MSGSAAERVTIIDPESGTKASGSSAPPPIPDGVSAGYGFDAAGRPIVRAGGVNEGDAYRIYIVLGGNRTQLIYSGIVGDSMDFSPFGPAVDGDSVWFGNSDNRYVWRWGASTGLKRFALMGAGPVGGPVDTRPAGPCL